MVNIVAEKGWTHPQTAYRPSLHSEVKGWSAEATDVKYDDYVLGISTHIWFIYWIICPIRTYILRSTIDYVPLVDIYVQYTNTTSYTHYLLLLCKGTYFSALRFWLPTLVR